MGRTTLIQGRAPGWKRGLTWIITGSLLASLSIVFGPGGARDAATAAPGDSFSTEYPTVFIAQGIPTQLQRTETTGTGEFEFKNEGAPTADLEYNAIGFNEADGYLYGVVANTRTTSYMPGSMIRIGQDAKVEPVGDGRVVTPEGRGASYAGAFGNDGLFYVARDAGTQLMAAVNVSTGEVEKTINLSDTMGGLDFAWSDGFFWAMTQSGLISRINVETGEVKKFRSGVTETGQYGAAWQFGNGNLGFSNNQSGNVYQISVANPESASPDFNVVSQVKGPASQRNDAASIMGSPVDLMLSKSGPEFFTPGDKIEYTIKVTNNGPGESSGWTVQDTLPSGVSSPVVVGGTSSYDPATRKLSISGGRLGVGETKQFTVSVDSDAGVNSCLTNVATAIGNELDPDKSNNTDDHKVCPRPTLSIAKTSNAGQSARVGDIVRYEVTVTNTGVTDFTSEHPASVVDDLSKVLDDATFNNDATMSFSADSTGPAPTFTGRALSWSGALRAGEIAKLSYSVKIIKSGDGLVLNTACVPEEFSEVDDNCATTTTRLPRLAIAKSSSIAALPENGGTVTYQVTVTNQGPGDTTVQNPATFSDDLSDVLDDGRFIDGSISASIGSATRSGNELTWTGELAASESATVTYQVEYDSNKGGDHRLINVACLPVELALDPQNPCREVQIPGAALQQWKTADPASGAVVAGQEITYTLHFRNTGQAAVAINNSDDLSAVVDDADLIAGPTSSSADLNPRLDGNTIRVSGTVPAGTEHSVSYTVKVRAFDDRGDGVLTNALAQCEANDTALCDPMVHRVPHLAVAKTSNVARANTGDKVTYTIRVTNDGTAAFTAADQASFIDTLTGVLDDAEYNDDAETTVGTLKYETPELSWSGPLAVGESATITYSVTVTNAGDHQLLNTVCAPIAGEDAVCASNTVVLPHLAVSKSVDPASGTTVRAGQIVSYTLSFANDGTAPAGVSYRDDLSDVLDDAEFGDGPISSGAALTAVKSADSITVNGELAVGEVVTVSYTVTVKADGQRGNNILGNVLADSENTDPKCGDDGVSCTENPIGELVTWKTVDPASGSTLRAGDTATYTLHFENTGKADVGVNHDDVLTEVLDDAVVTSGPQSSSESLTVSDIVDGRFNVAGTLAAGENETVTYAVTVKADGERGDDRLGNFLVPAGEEPPAKCEPVQDERSNCTVNHVSDVTVVKSSDPESGTKVNPGDDVSYTLTFTNRTKDLDSAPAEIDYTDHMKDVLDDAKLTAGPKSSDGSVVAKMEGDTIRITGAIPAGAVVTVSYTVKVKDYADQGDHALANVVAITGETPVCAPGSSLCTNHDVPPVKPVSPGLALTGSDGAFVSVTASIAVLMLVAGAVFFLRRRREQAE